jgi:hypothetical protein
MARLNATVPPDPRPKVESCAQLQRFGQRFTQLVEDDPANLRMAGCQVPGTTEAAHHREHLTNECAWLDTSGLFAPELKRPAERIKTRVEFGWARHVIDGAES